MVDEDVVEQLEKHIKELERRIEELEGSPNRRSRRRHDGVDNTDWETTGDEASEEEGNKSAGHPSRASSTRSRPAGEWDNFQRTHTQLEAGMLSHVENVARSRRPIIGSGSGYGAEVATMSASANPSVTTAAPTPDLNLTNPRTTRKTTHATIHLDSTRGATPDSDTRVKDVVRHFSNLSTLPPPSHRLAPSLPSRIATMFVPAARRVAPSPFQAPAPSPFQAPAPSAFQAPAPPPPTPPSPTPLSAPPPRAPRQLRDDGAMRDDGVINLVETLPDGAQFLGLFPPKEGLRIVHQDGGPINGGRPDVVGLTRMGKLVSFKRTFKKSDTPLEFLEKRKALMNTFKRTMPDETLYTYAS